MNFIQKKEQEIMDSCRKEAAKYVVEIDKIVDQIEIDDKKNKELKDQLHNERFAYLLNQERKLYNLTHGRTTLKKEKTNKNMVTIRIYVDLMAEGIGAVLGKEYICDKVREALEKYEVKEKTLEHLIAINYVKDYCKSTKIERTTLKNFSPVWDGMYVSKVQIKTFSSTVLKTNEELPYVELTFLNDVMYDFCKRKFKEVPLAYLISSDTFSDAISDVLNKEQNKENGEENE